MALSSGQAFVVWDRLLDTGGVGPLYLGQPQFAAMVVEAIHYNAQILGHYDLHAYTVMPNHVHMLITAHVPIPKLTKSLKGITAKRGNKILGVIGCPFWQEESFDREVRDQQEFERIRRYIEWNPVRAGLVLEPQQYLWSSASLDQ